MQTRIVVSTANPVTEICDGQAYARYYLCFYLFPATDYCLKPRLREFFPRLQQTALFPFGPANPNYENFRNRGFKQ